MSAVCPSWLSFILYNPVRKAFTDRQKILDESGITPDSVVLEIGAGNGFFTEVIAMRARKITAVELQTGMVNKLKKRIGGVHEKVDILQGDIALLDIGEGFADVCLMYFSFHEVNNKADAAVNISSAIRKGGILSIYEPTIEVSRGDMLKTIKLFEQKGFSMESGRSGLFTRFARLKKA
ncbi:MAG: methyltransferase domain-containing protein [Nitrospirota bacterium]